MKKTLFSLVAILALTVAGFAWAGQSAVPAPEVTEQPAADAVAPTTETAVDEVITLEDLFVDPVEVGACCFAQCMEEWNICVTGCPAYGEPGWSTCRAACQAQKESCQSNC